MHIRVIVFVGFCFILATDNVFFECLIAKITADRKRNLQR